MTYEIIKTLMPSEYVSQAIIDAKKGKVKQTNNCKVELNSTTKNLQFKILSKALPFPINEEFRPALELVPFQNELNRERLIILRASKGYYELRIDKEIIDTLSFEELNTGISLSSYWNTPQAKQAQKVFELCVEYHKIQAKLRSVAFVEYRMLNNYTGSSTVAGKKAYLDAKNAESIGKSWYNWNVATCEKYFQIEPQVQKLWEELKELRNQIYSQNIPVWHEYELIRVCL